MKWYQRTNHPFVIAVMLLLICILWSYQVFAQVRARGRRVPPQRKVLVQRRVDFRRIKLPQRERDRLQKHLGMLRQHPDKVLIISVGERARIKRSFSAHDLKYELVPEKQVTNTVPVTQGNTLSELILKNYGNINSRILRAVVEYNDIINADKIYTGEDLAFPTRIHDYDIFKPDKVLNDSASSKN